MSTETWVSVKHVAKLAEVGVALRQARASAEAGNGAA